MQTIWRLGNLLILPGLFLDTDWYDLDPRRSFFFLRCFSQKVCAVFSHLTRQNTLIAWLN
jgi:hypothetical protein